MDLSIQLYEITDGTFQEKNGCVELKKNAGGIPEVFVIAGNGTGSFLFRRASENGIPFAVGILGKMILIIRRQKRLRCR